MFYRIEALDNLGFKYLKYLNQQITIILIIIIKLTVYGYLYEKINSFSYHRLCSFF